MKAKINVFFIGLIWLTLILTTGCASDTMKKSGFLGDYSGLKPGPKGGADYVYIRENTDLKVYDKIMMDQVEFWFAEGAEYKGIQPDELQELADAFHKAMVEALQDGYPFVDKPGPGVMRIRPAITEVVPGKPGLNTITTIIPIGLAISSVKKATTGTHANVGQATLEVDILDAQTNERLAAALDQKAGEKYKVFEGMTKWGHVKDAFEFWAGRFRKKLDEIHGRR